VTSSFPVSSSLCFADTDDSTGDDTYYSPGEGDSAFKMGCAGGSDDDDNGTGGGGSSPNSDALSGGAIAGIVIGGVAFLAMCVGAAAYFLGVGFGGKAALASQAQSAAADNSKL
jgi:hypothetical protein